MAGRSRCCLRGSPNPLGFQSIANYHPNALLSSWRGGQPGARNVQGRGIQPCPICKAPPHLCSISVPLRKSRSILRRADTSFHLHHAIFIPHAEATTHGEEPTFMPSFSPSALHFTALNKRSHLWRGEGSARNERCPYVLNLRESLALAC